MAATVKTLYSGSSTGNLYLDRRQFYLKPNLVSEMWTDIAPFTTMVSSRPRMTGIPDPIFKLFEHRSSWTKQECVTTTAATSGDDNNVDTLTITAGSVVGLPAIDDSWVGLVFEVWDSTKTTKRGVCVVTAMVASTSIDVKNLSTTAFTTVSGDYLICIGNVQAEGGYAPEAWADDLRVVWGSTQMLETPVHVTGMLYQAALRGYSSELDRLRTEKNREHKMHIERTLLYGMSVIGTNLEVGGSESFADSYRTDANSKALRTTMGLVSAIEKYGSSTVTDDDQNIFSITEGAYKYSNFVDDMEKVFGYVPSSGDKYVFCGPGALSYWSKLDVNIAAKSDFKVRISASERDSLGFNVRFLETPHGVLRLVPTYAMRGPRNKWMVVVNDANLQFVQYQPSQFLNNIITENNYKGVKDTYFDDCGLGMTLIESHHLFKIV